MADLADELGNLEDPFRWCVYCGADCYPDADEQWHDEDCPSITGRYPIDHPNEKPEPPHACCRCEKEFERGKGQHYRLILAPGEDPDAPDGTGFHDAKTYLVVCEDCAMQVDLLDEPREDVRR